MMITRNTNIYYILNFLSWIFYIWTPIIILFYTQSVGLSLWWSIFLSTFSWLLSFFFEIPTGALVDIYGRKKTFIIGGFLSLVGMSIYLFTKDIYLLLGAITVLSFWQALTSGNIEWLLHDEYEILGKEKNFWDTMGHGMKFFFIGRGLSSLFSGILFTINPIFPFICSIVVQLISFFISFSLQDAWVQKKSKEKYIWKQIYKTFLTLWKKKDILYIIIFLTFISSIGNIYWFSYQAFFNQIWLTSVEIGIVYFWINIISAVGWHSIPYILKKYNEISITVWLLLVTFITSLTFTYNNFWINSFWIVLNGLIGGYIMAIGNSYIANKVEKQQKTTALSIFSFTITLWYFIFSSPIGFFADIFSLKNVYICIPFIVLVAILGQFIYKKMLLKSTI